MMAYKWNKKKKLAYVVFVGYAPGLYYTWAEVQKQINGFSGNRFLGFTSVEAAEEAWNDHVVSLEDTDTEDSCCLLDLDDLL